MLKRITWLFLLVAACSLGAGNLQSRHSSDLEGRNIRRIATLPPSVLRGGGSSQAPQGGSFEARSEGDAAETLARITQSALGAQPRWQIVSASEVREVAQSVPAGVEATRARQIG